MASAGVSQHEEMAIAERLVDEYQFTWTLAIDVVRTVLEYDGDRPVPKNPDPSLPHD